VVATDLFDGWVARQKGTASGRGQLFDHGADVLFIGSSLVLFAAKQRVSWWIPVAVTGAVVSYARDLWRDARCAAGVQVGRSALGHAAGVANYTLVGLLATDVSLPGAVPDWLVRMVARLTAGMNALAVTGRMWPRRRR